MSNKLVKNPKPKETLRCCYLRQRGFFQLFFEVDGVTKYPTLHASSFDFKGRKWKKNIEELADKLQKYGITKEDIERVVSEASREAHMKPPKYLR